MPSGQFTQQNYAIVTHKYNEWNATCLTLAKEIILLLEFFKPFIYSSALLNSTLPLTSTYMITTKKVVV